MVKIQHGVGVLTPALVHQARDVHVLAGDGGGEPAQRARDVVVKDVTTSQYLQYSSTVTYYDIMCYIPKDHFSDLESFVEEVKLAMKDLVPMIKPTYGQTQSFYDDSVKGHMISIQYKNYRNSSQGGRTWKN